MLPQNVGKNTKLWKLISKGENVCLVERHMHRRRNHWSKIHDSKKGLIAQVHIVGIPLPDDTWHASLSGATPSRLLEVGHVARIAIRSNSTRIPQRGTRGALPYSNSFREKHTSLVNVTSGR